MRDKRFVAVHRGGALSSKDHRTLMGWAISCFERVLAYYSSDLDEPLSAAIKVARDWQAGKCPTGDAIKAARRVHAFARTIDDPVARAVARSVGHGVATAHMADHCMGAALYAQKAIKLADQPIDEERAWQVKELNQLPAELAKLVEATMATKAKGLGL